MATDNELETLASFFSLFSDPTRLKIINALSDKEMCVCDLANLLKIKQPSISQHLKSLWQGKIIKRKKDGQHVFYSLDDDHIKQIYNLGDEHVKE